ncbi:MAG: endonuclease VIII [Candidatus Cyclonatronum sp.]|uniref:endonuclease VIII n=1 Tax=Cyclonatronum sp. TaxID=3024185 RepID=UPI0025BD3A3E|nr:endonuclease VIII [Cyclonatronum sp.]MCH8487799.1 endonuclease VIII [Cyclonatronum sp.]
MPEGPEIHLEAQKIREVLGGKTCTYTWFYHEHLKPFERELSDKKILDVQAYGKGLVISFEGDAHIYSHNQLYGRWYIARAGEYPDTTRSLRLELQTAHHSALLYSASEIDVMDAESLKTHPYLSAIGPDVLRCTVQDVLDQCRSRTFSNRAFSGLLLDQHFLAGVGNYLRSEILFCSGVHPSEKPSKLGEARLQHFAETALLISNRAFDTKGITLDESRVAQAKSAGIKRRGYRHYVFAREAEACYSCGTEIEKTAMNSRRIYLCKTCQPVPAKS